MGKTDAEKLAELEAKMHAIRARASAIKTRQSAAQRKLEIRRRIILGGMLLERAKSDTRYARQVAAMIADLTRPADRTAFDGFKVSAAAEAAASG